MEFALFQWIGGSLDTMLNTFVSETASNVIFGFQMLMLTGVTLYITLTGYAIASGAVESPFPTFIKHCLKIIIIAAFCMTADSYTTTVVSAIHGLETGLADIMSTSNSQASSIYEVLDNSADKGLNVAYDMLGKVAKRDFYEIGAMFWDAFNALLMAVAVFLIHLPAAATIILAKLGLGVLLGLGPLFVAALMFPVTAKWFDKWFQQVLAYVLEIAITMVVVSVGVALFKSLFDKVIKTNTDNPIGSFFLIIALAVIVFFALRKTSGLGAQLAGGIAFEAVTFRSMAQGVGNVVNPQTTRRDLQSGQMVKAGRTNHLIAGNTMWNPAYRQHVLQNTGKNWGPASGGSVDGK
ncbi:type IV secretion system protein [Orrella dioscoreae]|uniref:Type IV secretion system protein VirB6 n=1 Tax=Orrella dioscoreae TaxID=1851544 RepID=A0A1C3K2I9_9BURK|nr:type IV secretion system protein [Orrella dioscoreae]SBT25719.1 Type IV secretion system protein VirB6 [Orrella dioscoreae]SOE52100.1 Type IV secretion system protein VirB6 [Orrella dioscoreae]